LQDTAPVLLSHEPLVRLGAFALVFAAMALWEAFAPRRSLTISRLRRWPNNLGLVVLNTAALRITFPIAAAGMAILAQERGWGLLNMVTAPPWLRVAAALIALDLTLYAQHVMFHKVPVLWRFHRMHHADLDIDVTTGARFHPVEIFLSMAIKIAAVAVLGAPVVAVVTFEVLLNALAMFNHANISLPVTLDAVIRRLIVTPDMHRVHHSVRPEETNSNYGFQVSWWDRIFGTYRAEPADSQERMVIGLSEFRDPADLRLDRMLRQPFVGPNDDRTG